ncbi:transcription factor bHLH143-like [Salvia hispanica]|uniref:transcription factor bHLH143-like n=1 Tax=Salvia hispanica TaxID=49212 RepID=UPI002008FD43|nr:transcription factor bHLH143-like [Salvia hispanica]XP_047981538.1 transcription factor bHLH143-like [Salvia hispanica]XP_047981539.1 transcription factor bHLH143-like [Salvia hispanica]
MATAKESQAHQKFTARNSSYTDYMGMYYCQRTTANDAFIEQYASDSPSLNAGQQGAVVGFRPPHCNIRYATGDPYRKGSHCTMPCCPGVVDRKPVGAPQRRFLIFDQSKNHTRLFFSPSFSTLNRMFLSKTPASANGSFAKVDAHVNHCISKKPVVEEKWDENHPSYGKGEMDEDTDEINALLYSDSDEDDEVTSTGHSLPLSLDELTEEVARADHKSSKRKRLLDIRDEKSSFETSRRRLPHSYEGDEMGSRYSGDDDRRKKVKIREALKLLESIIPGLDESDPLSIIDGAVAYLKAMKSEAESLRRRKGATWTP